MAYPDYTNNFDTKWKDQSTPCKYDVDDPTFCSPMSVLSGLVSGFCERQAVVNSSFVTGTTASPVTSDWFAATSAGRDAIVDSCVQHVISHDLKPSDVGAESYKGPVDGSFHAVDHTSVLDGGTTKVTTYMTHMDGLIDSLVQTGEYKTDITGATAYTTFDQLASSASAAVAGTASACGLAVSGGTAYSSEFMPAFPKAWALERKWMMEQLRYTAGTYTSGIIDLAGPLSSCAADDTTSYTTVAACKDAIITSAGEHNTDQEYAENPHYSCHYLALTSGRPYGRDTIGRTFGIAVQGEYYDGSLQTWRPWKTDDYFGGNDGSDISLLRPIGDISLTPAAAIGQSVNTISVTFAQGSPLKWIDELVWDWTAATPADSRAIVIDNGVTSTITAGSTVGRFYDVRSGGSLILQYNQRLEYATVLVRSGGYLYMSNGAALNGCSVEKGGVLLGIPNVWKLAISGTYPLRDILTPLSNGDTYTQIINTVETITPPDDYDGGIDRQLYVASGGTLFLTPGNFSTQKEETVHNIGGNLIIGSGGLVVISGNKVVDGTDEWTHRMQSDQNVYVMSGGTFSIGQYAKCGWEYFYYGTHRYWMNMVVYPGGICNIDTTGHWDGEDDEVWIYEGDCEVELMAGAHMNITIESPPAGTCINFDIAIHFNKDVTFSTLGNYVTLKRSYGGTTTTLDVTTTRLFTSTYICCFTDMGVKANVVGNGTTAQFVTDGYAKIQCGENNVVLTPGTGNQGSYIYNEITLAEPGKTNIYIGRNATKALYRYCVESVLTLDGGGKDHYKEFRLRQNKT